MHATMVQCSGGCEQHICSTRTNCWWADSVHAQLLNSMGPMRSCCHKQTAELRVCTCLHTACLLVAGGNPCQVYNVCAGILNAVSNSCVPTPTSSSCSCSFGYTWNSVVFMCVDENGCQAAWCDNIQHALPGSCSDVPAPWVGFNCKCGPGFK
jgi:hypothetical protein